MPRQAWFAVVRRTWAEASDDNIGLVAAGVAFYGFLALVPMLGATVLLYGIFAEVDTVISHVTRLMSIMPTDIALLVGEQLLSVVTASSGKKGFGLLIALGVALFGARNAAGAIVTALNIVYEQKETRGFVRVNILSLTITAAAVTTVVAGLLGVAALGFVHLAIPSSPLLAAALRVLTYLALALLAAGAAATLYRYGPARSRARWSWITPGSALFAVAWVTLTLGFGFYVANFGSYGTTYGSLGAVVVLLTWMYLSAYALLFGADLNAELEHQTARDTTSGPEEPLGERGAWVADHVADD
jgi:membrane protein